MGAHQFAGDRQAETAAARAGRAEERAEQVFARLGRKTGSVVGDLDRDRPALADGGKPQPMRPRLDRVAGVSIGLRFPEEAGKRLEDFLRSVVSR